MGPEAYSQPEAVLSRRPAQAACPVDPGIRSKIFPGDRIAESIYGHKPA